MNAEAVSSDALNTFKTPTKNVFFPVLKNKLKLEMQ